MCWVKTTSLGGTIFKKGSDNNFSDTYEFVSVTVASESAVRTTSPMPDEVTVPATTTTLSAACDVMEATTPLSVTLVILVPPWKKPLPVIVTLVPD